MGGPLSGPVGGAEIMPYLTLVAGSTITSNWANANVRDQVVTPFASSSARSAAISTPVEGMVSYLADTNRLDWHDGSVWRPVVGAAAKVTRGTDQTLTTGVTTAITWSGTSYDSHSMFSGGSPTRLTAPWGGYFGVSTTILWASLLNGKERRTGIYLNGTLVDGQTYWSETALTNSGSFRQNVAVTGLLLTAGQYVEVQCFHDAGVDRTVSASVSNLVMNYEGPG
jgi:hypothetical protein